MTSRRAWTVGFDPLGHVVLWCEVCRRELRMEPIDDPGDGYLPPDAPRQCAHAPLFLIDPWLPCGHLRVLRRAVLPPDPGRRMKEPRKFFKTVITVTVLTEDGPVSEETPLDVVAQQIVNGDWSGTVEHDGGTELTPAQAAAALIDQGSDPEFFNLDVEGNDLDDLEEDEDDDEDDDEQDEDASGDEG